ncbi:MAG: hypothetical protein PHW74_09760 [Desulfobacca sp.]|nr:hypothetical protein [Desulfobacca sp.]
MSFFNDSCGSALNYCYENWLGGLTRTETERLYIAGINRGYQRVRPVLGDTSIFKNRCQITPSEEVLKKNLITSWLPDFQNRLREMRALPNNWDGRGTAAPNAMASINAWKVLMSLDEIDFVPAKLMPSAEEGIGIFFAKGNRYGFVECYNEGGIVVAMSDREGDRRILEIGDTPEEIKDALETLRDFIDV